MVTPFTGGCMCGAVRYEVPTKPLAQGVCHCRDCQYASGGAPANALIVARNSFKLTKGEPKAHESTSDRGSRVLRYFCVECGTPLFTESSANPELWVIKAGSLDDPSWFNPGLAQWTSSAQPWAHIDSSLPQFDKDSF